MNKATSCVILMVLRQSIHAESTTEQTCASNSTVYKILDDQEDLKDDFKALVLNFASNHFDGYQKNVVLSSIGCGICGRILGMLMSASAQSFLTVNDITSVDNSFIENAIKEDPVIRYDGFVVLLMQEISEFFKYFTKLRLMNAWNPRAHHLIFTVKNTDAQELKLLFKECWSHRVINVAVVIWNQKEAYTYNPYLKNDSDLREVRNWSELFYDKLGNMNGYSIRTKYIPFSSTDAAKWIEEEKRFKFFGSDFGYAEAFFQSVNATPAFMNLTVDMIPKYQNFTYRYNIWRERKFHGAELWMNFMPVQSPFGDRSERAYPLRRDNIRVLAPKSGLKLPSILEPYNNTTWICILLSLITFAFYSHFLYMSRGIDDNAFIRTLGIFLGKELANRRHGVLEKLSSLVFTMASLLIVSAYQGALYSALATVSYYPEINTMPELQKLTNTINTYPTFVDYLRRYAQPGISVELFETVDSMEYMKNHRDDVFAFPDSMAQVVVKLKILSENGVPLYHMMNEFSFPAFVSHTLPYGSPYLKKVERVFLACKEAGLNQYWEAEANLNDILTGRVISEDAEEKPLRKLSLQTQLITFYIWGAGLMVSGLCFTAEICYHKYGKKILEKLSRRK